MLFTEEQKEVLKAALDTYGIRSQQDIAIEEMSELTKAIIKSRRNPSAPAIENLLEEIADALIMLEQLTMHYGTEYISEFIQEKLIRLSLRIEEERSQRYGGMI